MFKKRAAINEAAKIISTQISSAVDQGSYKQIELIRSGYKWQSPFVLGYFNRTLANQYKLKGISNHISSGDLQKLIRKVSGRELEVVFLRLLMEMETEKSINEYEYGENAANIDNNSVICTLFKNYFLDQFDFDEGGRVIDKRAFELIAQIIVKWHKHNTRRIKSTIIGQKNLAQQRSIVGSILFFYGAIDFLSQQYDLDDITTAKLSIDLLENLGYRPDLLKPIYLNFYTNPNRSTFATHANHKGGRGLQVYLDDSTESPTLPRLVREWVKKPTLESDETWLIE